MAWDLDLNEFNLAMLGKVGWKLLTDPNALVSCVLKIKYHPQGNFLNVKFGQNPERAIPLLHNGFRWLIGEWGWMVLIIFGSGMTVGLRDPSNFQPTTSLPCPSKGVKTFWGFKDLFILGTVQFKWYIMEVLDELFNERDIQEIINIPPLYLTRRRATDWQYTRVKAGL